jgi:hypothetical protein
MAQDLGLASGLCASKPAYSEQPVLIGNLQAGVFAAAVTAFLIEASKQLQPDFAQQTALLLSVMVYEQFNSSSYIRQLPSPDSFLSNSISQARLSEAINVLWFTSLVLALITSLFCILVKQWLSVYRVPSTAESARAWARRRQLRYDGLITWKVPAIIAFLPSLLQVSLLLFLAGLVMFIWPLDPVARSITLGLSGLLTSCLLLFPVLSYLSPACPYRTRFTDTVLRSVYRATISIDRFVFVNAAYLLGKAATAASRCLAFLNREGIAESFASYGDNFIRAHKNEDWRRGRSNSEAENELIFRNGSKHDAAAIGWLHTSSPDVDVLDAILVALGSLLPFSATATYLRSSSIRHSIKLQFPWRNREDPSNAAGIDPVAKKWHLAVSRIGVEDALMARAIVAWVEKFRPGALDDTVASELMVSDEVDMYWSAVSQLHHRHLKHRPHLGRLLQQLEHVSDRTLVTLLWRWSAARIGIPGDVDHELQVMRIFNRRLSLLSEYPHLILLVLGKLDSYSTEKAPPTQRPAWSLAEVLLNADKLKGRSENDQMACKLVPCRSCYVLYSL